MTSRAEEAVRALAAAAQLVHREWEVIAQSHQISAIVSEVAGVLDCVTGMYNTYPEQRAEHHMCRINQWMNEL